MFSKFYKTVNNCKKGQLSATSDNHITKFSLLRLQYCRIKLDDEKYFYRQQYKRQNNHKYEIMMRKFLA